jgi:Ca2+-binding RTX toxin-like protein
MSVTANLSITDVGRMYTYVAGGTPITAERTIVFDVFAPATPGNYPVIFWSHGHRAPTSGDYFNIAKAWADAGYIVVVPTHLDSADNPQQGNIFDDRFPLEEPEWSVHRAQDMSFAFDEFATILADLNASTGGGYTGDLSDATIAGHSQGAFTAAILTGTQSTHAEFAGLADADFKQAVLFSPQGAVGASSWHGFYYNSPTDNSWANVTTPTMVLTGTDDNGTDGQTYQDRLDPFEYAPTTGHYAMVISGANHFDMGGGSDATVLAQEMAAATTFTDAYVKNNATAKAALNNVEAWQAAHPLFREVYEKAGTANGGSTAGAGFMAGGSAADILTGTVTADKIYGMNGNDTMNGGSGHDFLFGGAGADSLTGGSGNDIFDYNATSETGTGTSTRDKITDFRDSGADKIDLTGIDAITGGANNAFTWIGSAAFTAAGQARYVVSGGSLVIQLNTSGTSGAEATIELLNTTVGTGVGQMNSQRFGLLPLAGAGAFASGGGAQPRKSA